ncbi:hypothetical protein NIM87_00755 [Devosia sp. XJ19-1]|uniref:CENP-V/GFA domain-containing protein n=1 Tax=Devosia ureilytica TaxID=2952754 RepID=A0A9Q4FRC8_9HYPH|nr:hypothetical protein [Devosia ureilytica]MCP8882027.1 hypothetical protein [Devosia ureilytica]MCP8886087.1 hypothetical protein [Devosia ureilytica]
MTTTTLACQCGQFHVEVTDDPFITAECHCTSCRTAAQRLSVLPPAYPLTAPNGGVPYVLYRKDRVRFPDGTANLAEFRLSDSAPTRRVLTTCCNTPVFTEFEAAHWLSLFAGLWPAAQRPAMQIRTQTGDVPEGTKLDDSLPAGGMVTAGFYAKLLAAWIAMGFRVPKVEVGKKVSA